MKKIIIDTNFLMIPYKFKVDIFSEFERICNFNYKLFIFEQSINELKNIIKKNSGKDKTSAKFALKLIKLKNISTIKSEQWHASERVNEVNSLTRSQVTVDSLILNNLTKDTIIATQDRDLKKELLKKGSSVVIMRQKKYLVLIEN